MHYILTIAFCIIASSLHVNCLVIDRLNDQKYNCSCVNILDDLSVKINNVPLTEKQVQDIGDFVRGADFVCNRSLLRCLNIDLQHVGQNVVFSSASIYFQCNGMMAVCNGCSQLNATHVQCASAGSDTICC